MQNAGRAGRGIDHRGRGRTVKEDRPSGFILLGFGCCRSGKSESIGERLRVEGVAFVGFQPELSKYGFASQVSTAPRF